MRPRAALSPLAGDFNFAPARGDWLNKDTGISTGDSDAAEARHWRRLFSDEALFYEIWQMDATHDGPKSRLRLDRVYTNQHLCEQLDRLSFATALEWCPRLPRHRPLAFGRPTQPPRPASDAPVPEEVIRAETWPLRVSADFHSRLREAAADCGPFDRLAMLKLAIRCVSDRARAEMAPLQRPAPPSADDELAVVMCALWRLERRRWV